MKTLIIIPSYNGAKSLSGVISDLKRNGWANIVVIDDGSNDNTSDIAVKNKVPVIRHIVNRGLGAGIGTGFAYGKKTGADIIVTFDDDGQHVAKDITDLVAPIKKNLADVVIGSRMADSVDMPLSRKVANVLANTLTTLLFGVATTDSQSGFRAFNKKAIECIKIKTDRMEVSSEFFKEIRLNNLRFVEIPIKAIYTDESMAGSRQGSMASIRIAFKLLLRLFR